MGSLSSRPSVPSTPQVVYVPQPTTGGAGTIAPSTPAPADPSETAAEARRQSLLERNRGRFGTIQTSFRGLLSIADSLSGRKTLLGE